MRVVLLSEGRIGEDPRAKALGWSLRHVGHSVGTVGSGPVDWADTSTDVPGRLPSGPGRVRSLLRRAQPVGARARLRRRSLGRAVATMGADLVYPMSEKLVATADWSTTGAVFRQPQWSPPIRDIVRLAPGDARFSTSPAGPGLGHHLAPWQGPGSTPQAGRHAGRRIALVNRHSPTTPARYLRSALERAGVELIAPGPDFDLAEAEGCDAVVVVESPYPPPRLTGRRGRAPVLFWVHHGEHHLGANLRLVDRLAPDAVLLAHSWHLAHRFPVPVHRFPFGVPVELFDDPVKGWQDRVYDVAMVGVGMRAEGGRYDTRSAVVDRLQAALGDRTLFPQRVSPDDLAAIYADSRIVINDGGNRHHPITMRVFETVGAGALLLTEDQPGTDLLLRRGDYRVLDPGLVVEQVKSLAADPEAEEAARSAHAHGLSHHTYDHRVDELLAIVDATGPAGWPGRPLPSSPLARLVDSDVDVDVIAADGTIDFDGELPDRVVWEADDVVDRLTGGGMVDASAFTHDHGRLDDIVAGTRRFVYAHGRAIDPVMEAVRRHHPRSTFEVGDGLLRADTGTTERYRYAGTEAS